MKKTRRIISHEIGKTRDTIMTRDVTMEPLVDAEKTEDEGKHFVCSGAAFSLPKEGCQIVGVGKNSTFASRWGCGLQWMATKISRLRS